MTTKTDERRTIKIKNKTYQAIKKLGYFGETFDDVLQRILKVEKDKNAKSKPAKHEDYL